DPLLHNAIAPLSLHDALPISLDFGPQYRNAGTYSVIGGGLYSSGQRGYDIRYRAGELTIRPRPLTIVVEPDQAKIYGEDDPDLRSEEPRLNSSHVKISYAVIC